MGNPVSLRISNGLRRGDFESSLIVALGVSFDADGVAETDDVTYAFEPDDIFPPFEWVVDVFAEDAEAAAREVLDRLMSRFPSWRYRPSPAELPTAV